MESVAETVPKLAAGNSAGQLKVLVVEFTEVSGNLISGGYQVSQDDAGDVVFEQFRSIPQCRGQVSVGLRWFDVVNDVVHPLGHRVRRGGPIPRMLINLA
jgi:hypothetical protein